MTVKHVVNEVHYGKDVVEHEHYLLTANVDHSEGKPSLTNIPDLLHANCCSTQFYEG